MFIQECFIRKNTPNLRGYLKTLGYHVCSCCDDNLGWLVTFSNGEVHCSMEEEDQKEVIESSDLIECKREFTFKAMAGLSSTTDKYNLFICDDSRYDSHTGECYCQKGDYDICLEDEFVDWEGFAELWHKASVEEILQLDLN